MQSSTVMKSMFETVAVLFASYSIGNVHELSVLVVWTFIAPYKRNLANDKQIVSWSTQLQEH